MAKERPSLNLNPNLIWPIVVLVIALGAFIFKPWQQKPLETISVTADGKTQTTPDIAKITASVISENQNVETAKKDVDERVARIIGMLKDLGIEEKDIKTQNVSTGSGYEILTYPPTRPNTNQFTVTLEVNVKNLENTDEVITILTQNGISNLYGPTLTLSDEKFEAAKSQARQKAVENAKKKAEELASSAGRKIGKVSSIKEQGDYGFPQPLLAQSEADIKQKASIIQPGQNEVSITLQVDYALK